jgi:alpha-tubulin suppressor-like RCC1 family protein
MSLEPITNFKDSNGVDLGQKLITKDYLMSVYPSIAQEIGKTPELWTWGYNGQGRLGINDATNRLTPVTTFAGGANWKQVSINSVNAATIKTDGTLWVWGSGNFGPLGNNDTTNKSTPVTTFAGGTNWKQVNSGANHMAAIKTDGTLWTWGFGANGRLGTNDAISRSTPVTTFAGGNNWKQVSSGGAYTAAIKTDGTLWTWGQGNLGQLGNNDSIARSTPVTTFAGGTNWKQVSAGGFHVAAIKTDGTLWTWGRNNEGALGTNDTTNRSTPVTTFAGGTNWKLAGSAVSGNFTTAIKTDGTLWTWGINTIGQLGINDTTNRSTPVTTFAGGTNWKQVTGGNACTSAIKTDGTLWTCGNNSSGELGTNDLTNRSTPVTTFAGGTNWKQVSAGSNYIVAIESIDFI